MLLRERRLEQRDVRGVHVRAVECEAVGERLAVWREERVGKVESVQVGLGLHGTAQHRVEKLGKLARLVQRRRHRVHHHAKGAGRRERREARHIDVHHGSHRLLDALVPS